MNHKLKRITSFLISMIMLISLLPAVPVFAVSGEEIVFLPEPAGSEYSMKLESHLRCGTPSVNADRIRIYFPGNNTSGSFASFAIRINVPVNGKYALSVNAYSGGTRLGYANVYMAKVDENKSYAGSELFATFAKTANHIGEYSGVGDIGLQNVEYTFEEGDYLLVFIPSAKNKECDGYSAGIRNFIKSITLKPYATALPSEIHLDLSSDDMVVGETADFSVTDENRNAFGYGIDISYEVEDKNVVSVGNGTITALAPGRTKIKVTASLGGDEISAECEVNVVGDNLLIRPRKVGNKWQYWNHGDFAKSIYLNDKSNGVEVKDSFWKSSKHDGYDLELLENVTSDITGEPTNIVKLNFKENSIRIQAYKQPYYTNSDHRGFVDAAANKLYEFTGYVKSENTRSLPRLKLSTYYYNDTSKESTSVDSLSVLPWEGLSGDQAWTKFTVGSLYLNYGYGEEYGLEPRVDISNTNANGAEISLAHFEVREVAFDRAELSFAEEKNTYACGDTLTTELVLYSNTGNVITPGEALGPGEVTYSSSDPSVATVDETGVITVIKNGECEITATVTINGITRESTAPLSVSGVEKALNKAVASISKSALSKGETAEVSYELFDNEENLYTDKGVVYYESTDVSVAAVSQEGVVTAKAAGKTDIIVWVQSEGKLIRGAVSVTVTDDTLLASAQIRGKNIVEAGFSEKLYVRAWHESGKEAYLDACNVSFALKDNADAAILTVDENGTVSAISAGKATVIATVTGAQNSVTGELEIEVVPTSPKSKTIYFSKPGEGYALDVTMDDYGWEVNRELSSTSVGMVKSSAFTCRSTCIQSNINAVGNTRNADTAIDIWVDYDGWYDIDFLGVIYYRGPKRANLYMDGNYLGDFEFYTTFTTSRNFTELKSLNSMYLTKGKHTFIIRSMEKNPENSYAWHTPSAIMLKYVETPATIENVNVSVSDNELAVGESSAVSYETVMPNGRNYTFGKKHGNVADDANNITLESSDSGIVEIKNGRAVAVAPGTAEIKAIAKIGDETETASVTVTVNDLVLSRANFAAEKYDVHKTEILPLSVNAYLSNDEEVSSEDFEVTYTVDDSTVAKIEGKSGLLGVSNGTTTVRATVKLGNTTLTEVSAAVNVIDDGFSKVELGAVTQVIKAGGEGTDLFVRAFDNNDAEIPVPDDAVVYTSADENVVSVNSSTGRVTPVNEGVTTLTATVTIDGIVHSADIIISVRTGKVKSTFYTEEKVSAARENVKKYDWAKKIAETATKNADKYLASLDHIYNIIPANTIPRAYDMVEAKDPEIWHCIYCGTDLLKRYGKDCWGIDSINRPWKVQCPECKRLFPSNDFDSYYKNGLDEHGEFDYTLARENNGILCGRGERNEKGEYVVFDWAKDNPYGYGDPKGKLYNETYQELWTNPIDPWKKITITQGWGDFRTGDNSGVPSEGYFWGVDDGFGYDTGRKQTNGIRMVYRMAAVFAHEGLWFTNSAGTALIYNSLNAFRDAYLYTGDEKYGRAGAIILDRIADLYPDFDYAIDCPNLQSSHGGSGTGKIVGSIWENKLNRELSKSYDAFFDIYDDPEVIEYLSGYAEKWNLDNKKTNGDLIRQNAEENLLVETFRGVKKATIAGNFGMKQRSLALAAVILDREKDTQEMIDFIMQPGTTSQVICTGGNLMPTIINDVDRDGYGNESSYGYLIGWTANLLEMIEALADYGAVSDEDNLLKNNRFIKMLLVGSDSILAGVRRPNIGDNSSTFAGTKLGAVSEDWLVGFEYTKRPIFAQLMWLVNGNSAEGLHYDIFTKDPERLNDEIEETIKEHGTLPLSESSITTGYGLAVLRGGVMYNDVTSQTQENTMRDWWMYFGGAVTSHKHLDALNLGLDAFGLNMAPDIGYHSSSGGADAEKRGEWTSATISHNTVIINDMMQTRHKEAGYPYHFDDAGSVKVMDVDVPQAYPDVADVYRRTVVSVDVDDTVAYALDFFHVVGGNEHLYTFHSQSENSTVSGVEMIKQPYGTYAGVDVPYGDLTYKKKTGFNYLEHVSRAKDPETGEFSIDFKITDYRKLLPGKRNLHLKLTQLNAFDITEVAVAKGKPVEYESNPDYMDCLLVRRSGKDLDTLFTTVIEPYEDNPKIEKLTRVPLVRKDGKPVDENEPAAAIKVELENGRVDYVVYSANNDVPYTVGDNLFDFEGFVGVYSVAADDNTDVIRTYLHDGKTLGEKITGVDAAVTGEVVEFTEGLSLENFIEVTVEQSIDPASLVGKMIVVENDGVQNGAYIIKSAERKGDNVLLGTDDVGYVRSLADDGETFGYNIAKDQRYRIPLTVYNDVSPEISVSGDFSTSAGSSIRIPLNVISDREATLIGTTLPRGMSLNSETGVLTWKPDASQVGENHVAVKVDNGVMSDTAHFIVTVYGSTTGNASSDTTEIPGTGTTDTPAGGGGGGGGGAEPTDKPDDETNTDGDDTSGESGENEKNEGNTDNTGTENNALRFTDLGNHAWAENAINALATDGIIKGISASTFSPANNITRADFALLLVRAFGLESDNTENFADVSANDYFATELAIARNSGIVNGIGDNKFAPRNTITRQDMMVIVYRALQKLDVKFDIYDEPQYPDFADVADYAKTAVSALISAGLVKGKSERIAPTDYTTRAEVAVLIKRILDYKASLA